MKRLIILALSATAMLCCLSFNSFAGGHTVPGDDSTLLRNTVTRFMHAVDSSKAAEVIPFYDPGFVSVRVVDQGKFIKMNLAQMTWFWKKQASGQHTSGSFDHSAITNLTTTVHDVDIMGDTAVVLLTRIKDLGSGPEPMFYNLLWKKKNDQWYLLREIVHQRTMPKF